MKANALIAGKYRLTRPIGQGSMGTVWEATHEGTSRQVAVKLITSPTDELRVRLIREARAYGALRHRNIVEVLDVGETDTGDPFLVMQFLLGETLGERLSRQRRLGVPEAALIARAIARALAAAHAASIIHRDLKPANIFLHDEPGDEGTIVKVVDFGVSKNLLVTDGPATVVGGMVGSLAYMSPEQAAAGTRGPVDHRADLWSLGVVLFEMLTGVRPLQGDAITIIPQIISAEIPLVTRFVRTIDPGLAALVARCLERDLTKRVGSAADLAAQLQIYTTASAGSSLGQSSAGVASPSSRSDPAMRAVMPSLSEMEPPIRSSRPQEGPWAPGPVMPGADDGEDAATAKISPDVLRGLRPAAPSASPQMPSFAGGTVPIQAPGPASFQAPPSWAGPVPTTAKLDPSSAWAPAPPVAEGGTVRIPAEAVNRPSRPGFEPPAFGPPPGPPPPSGGLSPVSSLAGLVPQSHVDPSRASQAAGLQQQPKRGRGALFVMGSALGVALAILVVVVIRTKMGAAPAPSVAAPELGSPIASATPSASAVATDKPADPAVATNAPPPVEANPIDKPTVTGPALVVKDKPPPAGNAAPGGGGKEFDRAAAKAALTSAAGAAAGCKKDHGPTGVGKARVTFAPSGSAISVAIDPPFTGPPLGSCLASVFHGVHVPAFNGAAITVEKSFSIH